MSKTAPSSYHLPPISSRSRGLERSVAWLAGDLYPGRFIVGRLKRRALERNPKNIPLFASALNARNGHVAQIAYRGLALTRHPDATDAIIDKTDWRSTWAARMAARALTAIPDPLAGRKLAQRLDDTSSIDTFNHVLDELARHPSKAAVRLLVQVALYARRDSVQLQSLNALGYSRHPSAMEELQRFTTDAQRAKQTEGRQWQVKSRIGTQAMIAHLPRDWTRKVLDAQKIRKYEVGGIAKGLNDHQAPHLFWTFVRQVVKHASAFQQKDPARGLEDLLNTIQTPTALPALAFLARHWKLSINSQVHFGKLIQKLSAKPQLIQGAFSPATATALVNVAHAFARQLFGTNGKSKRRLARYKPPTTRKTPARSPTRAPRGYSSNKSTPLKPLCSSKNRNPPFDSSPLIHN